VPVIRHNPRYSHVERRAADHSANIGSSLIAVICNGQLSSPAWALPETPPCNGHSNADY